MILICFADAHFKMTMNKKKCEFKINYVSWSMVNQPDNYTHFCSIRIEIHVKTILNMLLILVHVYIICTQKCLSVKTI